MHNFSAGLRKIPSESTPAEGRSLTYGPGGTVRRRAATMPCSKRVPDRGAAIRDAKLPIDVGEVELHRVLADPQVTTDDGGRRALRNGNQDLLLASSHGVARARSSGRGSGAAAPLDRHRRARGKPRLAHLAQDRRHIRGAVLLTMNALAPARRAPATDARSSLADRMTSLISGHVCAAGDEIKPFGPRHPQVRQDDARGAPLDQGHQLRPRFALVRRSPCRL